MDANLINILIFLALIAVGYVAGTIAEKNHYASIKRREEHMRAQPVVSFEEMETPANMRVKKSRLVTGSAVISTDYFKRFLASLRFLVGGRVKSYESLLDRARREAIIRMKRKAGGAEIILGLRIETSNIGSTRGNNKGLTSVEAFAYGTAVWFD
jgi:uncharacterized protein YbjQ (UPF0145 family)